MNKTIIIAGGACVASLAAGAAGGYFVAKNKLGKAFDKRLEHELELTKKRYSVMLQNAKPSPEDITKLREDEEVSEPEEEPSEEELLAQAELQRNGERALIDYRGISAKPAPEEVTRNIFAENSKKPAHPPREPESKTPPRDPGSGRFITKQRDPDQPVDDPPYEISQDEFLANVPEYHQENLKYFLNDKVLMKVFDGELEEMDVGIVGENNLGSFDLTIPDSEENIKCFRNDKLEMDFEVQLMYVSLTEFMGLDENTGDDDPDEEEDSGDPDWAESRRTY